MANFVQVTDAAIPSDICREIIRRFDRSSAKAAGATGSGVDPAKKHSVDLVISQRAEWEDILDPLHDSVSQALLEYVFKFPSLVLGAIAPTVVDPETGGLVTLTLENWTQIGARFLPALVRRAYRMGDTIVQRYQQNEGNYQHWHSEVYPERLGSGALQRVLFWIGYLNDVTQGGETEFLHQSLSVQPKMGRLLIAPTAFTHTHRGNVPESGHKYIVTSWLLFRTAAELYGEATPER